MKKLTFVFLFLLISFSSAYSQVSYLDNISEYVLNIERIINGEYETLEGDSSELKILTYYNLYPYDRLMHNHLGKVSLHSYAFTLDSKIYLLPDLSFFNPGKASVRDENFSSIHFGFTPDRTGVLIYLISPKHGWFNTFVDIVDDENRITFEEIPTRAWGNS